MVYSAVPFVLPSTLTSNPSVVILVDTLGMETTLASSSSSNMAISSSVPLVYASILSSSLAS